MRYTFFFFYFNNCISFKESQCTITLSFYKNDNKRLPSSLSSFKRPSKHNKIKYSSFKRKVKHANVTIIIWTKCLEEHKIFRYIHNILLCWVKYTTHVKSVADSSVLTPIKVALAVSTSESVLPNFFYAIDPEPSSIV